MSGDDERDHLPVCYQERGYAALPAYACAQRDEGFARDHACGEPRHLGVQHRCICGRRWESARAAPPACGESHGPA